MKAFIFIVSSICAACLFTPESAFAQLPKVVRGANAASKAVSRAGSAARSSGAVTRSVRAASVPVSAAPSVSKAVPTVPSGLSRPVGSVGAQPLVPSDIYREKLERSVANLKEENLRLKQMLSSVETNFSPLLRSTFQARQTGVDRTNFFSGTVFKTVYNGEKEIYGVVAAHSIADSPSELALHRHFTADVYANGKFVSVEAEVVQVGAPSLLDVALVKFRPEDEVLFRPLEISEVPVRFGALLESQGFAGNSSVNIPGRYTLDVTPVSLRTTMPFARDERPGLCGSAVVDADNRLVGIHTGSSYGRFSEQDDVGFATNAKFLNTLVEAYHNGGEAVFPFSLNGQKIVDLNVDEYISYVTLQDASGKNVWQKGFDSKFSYSKVKEALEIYAPRYIQLTVRRAHWDETHPDVLVEVRASHDRNRTTYTYDFEEQKITSVSKPKPKR